MDETSAVVTIPIGTSLKDAVKALIEGTLTKTDGNISVTSKILRIDRWTWYAKMDKYKIPRCARATTPMCVTRRSTLRGTVTK